jgi:methylmalonyl-CoA mutase N-terminal domain/subunit
VEHLTSELEESALALLSREDELGGAERAIARGFFQEEIARSAYDYQLRVERGEVVVVGVNRFADGQESRTVPAPDYTRLELEQVERTRALRARRDRSAWERALMALRRAADTSSGTFRAPLMPCIIDAVRARATLGEISDALAASWGVYRPAA